MKIGIVGAGRVGSTAAFVLLERGLCEELVLVDVLGERAQGEALDLRHCKASFRKHVKIAGGSDYSLLRDCDLIIITAGVPRKPGESRLDLNRKNAEIMKGVIEGIIKHNSKAMLFVISNPVDIMTYLAAKFSGFEKRRVFGLGTMLDSLRLRSLLAEAFGAKASDVQAFVVGEHGDSMLPVFSAAKIKGKPLRKHEDCSEAKLGEVFEATKKGGGEVIRMKGGTWFAPALAIAEVVESVAKKPRVLPVSVYREELGIYIGSLAKLSRKGALAAKQELDAQESARFEESARVIKSAIQELGI